MSKKKFNDGLESVFIIDKAERAGVGSSFLMGDNSHEVEVKAVEKRTNNHKNFLSDLDSLLQEALHDNINDFNRGMSSSSSAVSTGKSKSNNPTEARSYAGLDSLIRQTVDLKNFEQDELGKKRISFSVDRSKLDQLKSIARLEKAFLKDVLSKLIDEYIHEYSSDKGIDV
jgi:hypothetical protein